MSEFFTWTSLATFAGCVLGTGIVTQFTKGLFPKFPTQWLSYIIAVVILFAATLFTGALTAASAALVPFNAIIVAMSANGAYSAIKRVSDGK